MRSIGLLLAGAGGFAFAPGVSAQTPLSPPARAAEYRAESAAPPVLRLLDSLTVDTVGEQSLHRIIFALSESIPNDARFRLTFPAGFGLGLVDPFYDDDDTTTNKPRASQTTLIDGHSIWIYLDTSGVPAAAGTTLRLKLSDVLNDTVAGGYQVALEVYSNADSLLFGPTLTSPFALRPGPADSLSLTPSQPISLSAGSSRLFSASVRDRYGNLLSNPAVGFRVEPAYLGILTGGLFQARIVDTGVVIASYSGKADTSGKITVGPGVLASWQVSGIPSTLVAGARPGSDSVRVTARDAFGNTKTDFTGSLWFRANDTTALFPATVSAPYSFTPADAGRVAFAPTSFALFRAGFDTVRVSNGSVQEAVPVIVYPGPAAAFRISGPDSAVAGAPIFISADSVVDVFGNPADGAITLFLNSGDSTAPYGQVASLPTLIASDGVGITTPVLYRSGRYPLGGRLGAYVRLVDSITVRAAATSTFAWSLASPQVSGQPLQSPASLTANDRYGNTVVHYSSVGSPVILSADNGDGISHPTVEPNGFISGVADLAALGVTYLGRGGTVRFTATAGDASGLSDPVFFLGLFVDTLQLDAGPVRRGIDTLRGVITVSIEGAGTATVTALELIMDQSSYPLFDITPALPQAWSGPGARDFTFRWPVPAGAPLGCSPTGVRVEGSFGGQLATDDFLGGPCLDIVTAAEVEWTSLSPVNLAYGPVIYRADLLNRGGSGLTLDLDSSFLYVADGGGRLDSARSISGGQVVLDSGSSRMVLFSADHAAAFTGDSAAATLDLFGLEAGRPVTLTLTHPAPLRFGAPVSLAYRANSLTPDTLLLDRADTVYVGMVNTGSVSLDAVRTDDVYLELRSPVDTTRLELIPSLTPLSTLPPGDTTLAFFLSQAGARLTGGDYDLYVSIPGEQNHVPYLATLAISESLFLSGAPRVRIDSVWATAPNLPTVTTGQSFAVSVAVRNVGSETLDPLVVTIRRQDDTLTATPKPAPRLLPDSTVVLSWSVVADSVPHPLRTFQVIISEARGLQSGGAAEVVAALDDQASVQVQSPAQLEVSARIVGPPEAMDGRVAAGSQFLVAGTFRNVGEAQVSGADLRLQVGAGLTISGSDVISVGPGIDALWTVNVATLEVATSLEVALASAPQELNTAAPAQIARNSDSLPVTVAFEAPVLAIFAVESSGGSVQGEFSPLRWQWSNEDVSGLFPILVRGIEFEVLSGDGQSLLDARSVATDAWLELEGDTVPGDLSSGVIRFGADSLLRVAPADTGRASLRLRTVASGEVREFRVAATAAGWTAIERSAGGSGLAVGIRDERGRDLDMRSALFFLPGSRAVNYPNPFRAGSELTHLQYSLPSNQAVSIRIYTVAGREVWAFEAAPGAVGGNAGANTVAWDGRNTEGRTVVDGVYIAHVTGGGLDDKIKIVVLK